jgi:flagellar protein FlgJ
MNVTGPTASPTTLPTKRARTPEEAAKQFEEVLVKQFVRSMTDGLFDSSLAGEDAPGWTGAYADLQKDALTDQLAQHLIKSGTLRIEEMLLRQWKQSGRLPGDDPAPAAPVPGDPSLHAA